jgi:phosphatidylglycerol---prolipoprotein diacylglyceryl transferase
VFEISPSRSPLHRPALPRIIPAARVLVRSSSDCEATPIHFPVYLPVGPFRISAHFIFETIAYTIGFLFYRQLRESYGDRIPDAARWSVIAAAAAGAAIGGKVLFWFENPHLLASGWRDPAYLLGGKTIVGALIGGLFAVELAKKLLHESRSTGDLFAAPIALGLAVGRVGCFLAGLPDHTYGKPSSLPWAVNFGDGVPRHPTQLYETIFALLLCFALLRALRRPHRSGDVFRLFMVCYFGWRLAIDFLKPDVRLHGLSSIQWASAAMLLYYSRDIYRWLSAGFQAGAPESEMESRPENLASRTSPQAAR